MIERLFNVLSLQIERKFIKGLIKIIKYCLYNVLYISKKEKK